MDNDLIRSTVYLRSELHQALRIKAASVKRSMSDLINEAILRELQEDEEDLAAFDKRASEKTLSYETFLARLKADGTL